MKLHCIVTAVDQQDGQHIGGSVLRIALRGRPPKAAKWRDLSLQTIAVPLTEASRRAFYVGRLVDVTVRAR